MPADYTLWAFGIILDDQNRILLVLRNDIPFWNLPWWWIESWETPWEWVVREIKEETGLNTQVERLVGVYTKHNKNEIIFLFLCKTIWGSLKLNEEAQDFWRYSNNEIPENTFFNHKVRINDFFDQNTDKVILKTHKKP